MVRSSRSEPDVNGDDTLMAPVRLPSGIFSIGYGGRRLSQFVEVLARYAIDVLVDVRLSPVTRIPGFSGTHLRRSLDAVGIEYRHEPRLGNPPENRQSFHDGEPTAGRQRYHDIVIHDAWDVVVQLVETATTRRVAILCAERDVERCHRQVILDVARQLDPTVSITLVS